MTKSHTPTPEECLVAAASYLLWFVSGIAVLLVEKKSAYVRFHAMQSMIFFGAMFVVFLLLGFIPLLGWLAGLFILMFVFFIMWIVMMWKAFQGEMYHIPYFGQLSDKLLHKVK